MIPRFAQALEDAEHDGDFAYANGLKDGYRMALESKEVKELRDSYAWVIHKMGLSAQYQERLESFDKICEEINDKP